MTTTPDHKIIIVAGDEFRVPVDTDNEQVRQALVGNFPDVASASIKTGTKTVDGVKYETVEFVKKAGTKGLSGDDVAALLCSVPGTPSASVRRHPSAGAVLDRLFTGRLTFAEAESEEQWDQIHDSLHQMTDSGARAPEGAHVCSAFDRLGAVAGSLSHTW